MEKGGNSNQNTLKIAVTVVVVPLLLAGVALWQITRVFEAEMSYDPVFEFSLPLTVSALCVALLAAAFGAWGLLRIRSMGRQAMVSREALLNAFASGQRLLPWLSAGTTFLVLMAIAICVSFELLNLVQSDHSRKSLKLLIVGTVFVIGLVSMAFKVVWKIYRASGQLFTPEPFKLMGHRVSEAEMPALWDFVREVAFKARVDMPNHIVAGVDACFFVTEGKVHLHNGEELPPGRMLYLPMPYMAFMERDEVAAVIGHELAHFSGADTEYSLKFTPIYAGTINNLEALYNAEDGERSWKTRPAHMMCEFFLETFDLAVNHWSRERELVADRVGASVGGARAVGLSLLVTGMLAPHVAAVLVRQAGKSVQGGILGQVIANVRSEGLGDPRAHFDDELPHPIDTHPTIRQRFAALGISEDQALFDDAARTRCSSLLLELGLAQAGDLGEDPETADAQAETVTPSLNQRLEAEFKQAMQDERAQQVEVLRALAAQGRETLGVYESVGGRIFTLLLISSGFVIVGTGMGSAGHELAWFVILCGLGPMIPCFFLWRRRKKPFVTFTEHGLLCANLTQPVPWTMVENYEFTLGSTSSLNLTLDLSEDCNLSSLVGDRRVKYIAKTRKLHFAVLSLRRTSPERLSADLMIYWNGGLARAQLAEWGES